jgi:DNA-directed RNA polymerase specialized sigma24 family protein
MALNGNDTNRSLDPARAFATTHWSVVLNAGSEDSSQALIAIEKLARAYWYPLYAYVRRKGHDAHTAENLTQDFFARVISRIAPHASLQNFFVFARHSVILRPIESRRA